MFSGRITASFVIAGAIAKQLLSKTLKIKILGYTSSIGGISIPSANLTEIIDKIEQNIVRCPDPVKAKEMIEAIEKAQQEGDSLGGAIDCVAINIPIGLGDPIFDTLEGAIRSRVFRPNISKVLSRYYKAITPIVEKAPINLSFLFDEGQRTAEEN